MAIGTGLALALGAGSAIAGAIGGAGGGQKQTSTSSVQETGLARQAGSIAGQNLDQLNQLVGVGPGAGDVQSGLGAQRGLAALLQQYQQTGGVPGQKDLAQGNQFASAVYQPQQVALQQAFQQQGIDANRQAALMGRGVDDPILRAKLAQSQTQQQALLGAQQGAFGAQYAQQIAGNRLDFAGQRAQILGGLATQAMANRQALAAMGTNIRGAELGYANKTNVQETAPRDPLAMGIAGGFGGLLQGLGTGFGLMNQSKIANAFAGAGAGASAEPSGYGGLNAAGQYAAPALQYQYGVTAGPPSMNQAMQLGWGNMVPGAMNLNGQAPSRWTPNVTPLGG